MSENKCGHLIFSLCFFRIPFRIPGKSMGIFNNDDSDFFFFFVRIWGHFLFCCACFIILNYPGSHFFICCASITSPLFPLIPKENSTKRPLLISLRFETWLFTDHQRPREEAFKESCPMGFKPGVLVPQRRATGCALVTKSDGVESH